MNTDEHVGYGDKLKISLLRVGEVNLKIQKNMSQRGFSSVWRMETYSMARQLCGRGFLIVLLGNPAG